MKRCSDCGETKPIDCYWKNATRKDGRQSICRFCAQKRNTAWIKANPEKFRDANHKRRKADPEKFRNIERKQRKANPEKRRISSERGKRKMQNNNYQKLSEMFGPTCLDCGQEYPMQIFDYHHNDPATKNRKLRIYSWNWARVKAYVGEGVAQLCPTCHRLRHAEKFQNTMAKPGREKFRLWREKSRDRNYTYLVALFGPACLDCGREYPMRVFDYHHLNPAAKKEKLSMNWSWKHIEDYVRGCDQLCPTCHQLRHFSERAKRRVTF